MTGTPTDYMHGLRRWSVYTTDGRKTTYAQTAEQAAKRAERRGLEVLGVAPAPHPVDLMSDAEFAALMRRIREG